MTKSLRRPLPREAVRAAIVGQLTEPLELANELQPHYGSAIDFGASDRRRLSAANSCRSSPMRNFPPRKPLKIHEMGKESHAATPS
jgi:hypothetical protein